MYSVNHGKQMDEIINIDDTMFNTGRLRLRNFYDELWNTLTHQPMQEVDSAITRGVIFERLTLRADFKFCFSVD